MIAAKIWFRRNRPITHSRSVTYTCTSARVDWADFRADAGFKVSGSWLERNVRPLDFGASRGIIFIEVENLRLLLIKIGTRIRSLVFQHLDKSIEANCTESTQSWAYPIDPVFGGELSERDAWTEGACRVEGAWTLSLAQRSD